MNRSLRDGDLQGGGAPALRTGLVLTVAGALLLIAGTASLAKAQTQSQKQTPTYSVLYSFNCTTVGGGFPVGGPIEDSSGNLYGATGGTAFELSPSGVETTLHVFGLSNSDGSDPQGGVLRDPAGNLYGTTFAGGIADCSGFGCGTVFKLAPNHRETQLYRFTGDPDGQGPIGNLVSDATGNLYGNTNLGGFSEGGIVFEVSRTGAETILHTFTGGTDGAEPFAGLVRDPAGNLYGTTYSGGTFGSGTVFELTPAGIETILHNFDLTTTDGANPFAGLVRDSAGNLYGTTNGGGTFSSGTIFKLDPTGAETILFNFNGGSQGAFPVGLARDAKGDLFGVTFNGGRSTACTGGCGVVFELSPTGQETVLHSFTGPPDGKLGAGSPLLDSAGNLYGYTSEGGTSSGNMGNGCGIVFKITP